MSDEAIEAGDTRSVSFTGRLSGDGACFCWDAVPIEQRSAIVATHAVDVEQGDQPDRMYVFDVLDHLGCTSGGHYRFTITVEPVDSPSEASQFISGNKLTGVGELEAVPTGVYYSLEQDNFYTIRSSFGMGMAFYTQWRSRLDEFPSTWEIQDYSGKCCGDAIAFSSEEALAKYAARRDVPREKLEHYQAIRR